MRFAPVGLIKDWLLKPGQIAMAAYSVWFWLTGVHPSQADQDSTKHRALLIGGTGADFLNKVLVMSDGTRRQIYCAPSSALGNQVLGHSSAAFQGIFRGANRK